MKEIIFATGNRNKLFEVERMLDGYKLLTPADIGISEDIPEDMPTLEGNSQQKARYLYDRKGCDCFADDTGLEVEALGGEPGVLSARYAGESKSAQDNMALLLKNLEGNDNRRACFRTIITLILGGKEYQFEGRVDGTITREQSGAEGFGYDPIFVPDGYDITFAQMDADTKNAISHRGRAVAALVEFLNSREK